MSTHTTASTSVTRRLALLALGLLVALTGVGLGSAPASAITPNQPVEIFAKGYDDFVRVYWAPPAFADPVITSYRIERLVKGQNVAQKVWSQTTTAPLVDTTAVDGVTYTYRVRSHNADGHSPWTEYVNVELDPWETEHSEFATPGDFVVRQYQDFLGRNPGIGEKQTAALNIANGTSTTGDLIDNLVFRAERAHRHQIIRLYNAYFGRTADHAGLTYWSDQITDHEKSINTVSSSFASSPEFKTLYGPLTNAQFVTLVYQNVLDRNPNNADHAYWKGQLDQGKVSRGRLMTLFSESSEYKALSRGRVLAADVHDAMLGTTIGPATLATFGRHIQGGGNAGDYGTAVMLLNTY